MTDLEMTKLCAEAMGFSPLVAIPMAKRHQCMHPQYAYDPLHDDAQAMALVKRFGLTIGHDSRLPEKTWRVFLSTGLDDAYSKDLNRAIVECVAKLAVTSPPASNVTPAV